jgi:hypothetical protein
MQLIGKKIGGRGNAIKEEVLSDGDESEKEIKVIKEEPKVKKARKKSFFR